MIIADIRTGDARDSTGRTWIANLKLYGIHCTGQRSSEMKPILGMKRRLLLPGALAINKHNCPNLIKCFQNWSYPIDKTTGTPIPGRGPTHKFSDSMKAIAYLDDYLNDHKKTERTNEFQDWDFEVIPSRLK